MFWKYHQLDHKQLENYVRKDYMWLAWIQSKSITKNLSKLTFTLLLFPIRHPHPYFINSHPSNILLHTKDILGWVLASRIEVFGKYIFFSTLATKESSLVRILQPCFANSAKLKASSSRKPIPPFALGLHIELQALQHMLLLVPFLPHQNCLIMPSISSYKDLDNKKHCMAYVRIACNTDLVNISLPAWDRIFSFYPCSFFQTLSFRYWNVCLLEWPSKYGNPRYLSFLHALWNS